MDEKGRSDFYYNNLLLPFLTRFKIIVSCKMVTRKMDTVLVVHFCALITGLNFGELGQKIGSNVCKMKWIIS